MTDATPAPPRRPNLLALVPGLAGTTRATIVADVIAGATLAAVAIPESMGYTKIAGMPVITGIYTLALPVIVFALIGSSRHLVVGADSATAAIMFAALIGIAKPASPEYVGLAGVIALLAAGYLLVARVLRLGFLADFLSRTALVGFLSGVGVQVALTQLPSMLGVRASGSDVNQCERAFAGDDDVLQLGHAAVAEERRQPARMSQNVGQIRNLREPRSAQQFFHPVARIALSQSGDRRIHGNHQGRKSCAASPVESAFRGLTSAHQI